MFSILASAVVTYTLFLPMVFSPVQTTPGAEIFVGNGTTLESRIQEISPAFIHYHIMWYKVEPNPGDRIWSADTDNDIDTILRYGSIPVVVLKMAPRWARASDTLCDRVTDLPAFARFAHDAALRYPKVIYWEIWNEEDLPITYCSNCGAACGCWANLNEPYSGGAYYAQVLEAVYPAIKQANPNAKVVFGGLWLDYRLTGMPSMYLEGALREHPPVDILNVHIYVNYKVEPDQVLAIRKRIDFVRDVAGRYGYENKPIIVSEVALRCQPQYYDCPVDKLDDPFYSAQADFLKLMGGVMREENVLAWMWYPLPNGGWNDTGLLFLDGTPKPAYYKFLEVR